MRDLSKLLWCDLQTDRERLEFIRSGLASDTGILARAMVEDLVEVYRRIDDAISRAELAIQFGPTIDNGLACVFACDVADVVKILRANSLTILEGSP